MVFLLCLMLMAHRRHGRGIKMLKANEAWTITKKYDKYAEQLAQIEVAIRDEAERGGACTWWHCENMTDYEREILAIRLKEFDYAVTSGDSMIYINWRGK